MATLWAREELLMNLGICKNEVVNRGSWCSWLPMTNSDRLVKHESDGSAVQDAMDAQGVLHGTCIKLKSRRCLCPRPQNESISALLCERNPIPLDANRDSLHKTVKNILQHRIDVKYDSCNFVRKAFEKGVTVTGNGRLFLLISAADKHGKRCLNPFNRDQFPASLPERCATAEDKYYLPQSMGHINNLAYEVDECQLLCALVYNCDDFVFSYANFCAIFKTYRRGDPDFPGGISYQISWNLNKKFILGTKDSAYSIVDYNQAHSNTYVFKPFSDAIVSFAYQSISY
ncbi:hypothetical protein Ciccas_013891 [Cichlidogyrus casuarinus]|uniref:Uncharacterized protein n=1 Tax=Cichlidogyrus casuarinus TaxID=1844966 RepID=A0ABD2PJE6_9PLAT